MALRANGGKSGGALPKLHSFGPTTAIFCPKQPPKAPSNWRNAGKWTAHATTGLGFPLPLIPSGVADAGGTSDVDPQLGALGPIVPRGGGEACH